jgi:hypothetical protein
MGCRVDKINTFSASAISRSGAFRCRQFTHVPQLLIPEDLRIWEINRPYVPIYPDLLFILAIKLYFWSNKRCHLPKCLVDHNNSRLPRWPASQFQGSPMSMSSMEASLETTATPSGARETLVQTSCLRACEVHRKLQTS